MVHYSDVEYIKLSFFGKIGYKLGLFFTAIPKHLLMFLFGIGRFFKKFGLWVRDEFVDLFLTFKNGDYKTRVSYVIMGFGSLLRGQWVRGLIFLAAEVAFIFYMIYAGAYYLSMLTTLGKVATHFDKATGVKVAGDNSFKILLYILLTFLFIGAVIWTWRFQIKQNKIAQNILADGRKLRSGKEDLQSLLDDQFHKTLLALPLAGIVVFTIIPIIFMILVAFTNYGNKHDPASGQLFTWVGWENFRLMFTMNSKGSSTFASTFGEILVWTLEWSFFATFLNYILGICVALMINKKGIKLKKLWRGVLVLTIAVPQFISLLYIAKTWSNNGYIIAFLVKLGIVKTGFSFWDSVTWSRVLIIVINIWIGIPYLMLIASGVLMNVPADLYESAKIDGAGPFKQFTKITLPYLLFVTGPYLLTSFTGNINNFNVIYLLTGGNPADIHTVTMQMSDKTTITSSTGGTDLLITWLYKLTVGGSDGVYYNIAAVISILVFLVVAIISLIVYNILPSNRGEEDFS